MAFFRIRQIPRSAQSDGPSLVGLAEGPTCGQGSLLAHLTVSLEDAEHLLQAGLWLGAPDWGSGALWFESGLPDHFSYLSESCAGSSSCTTANLLQTPGL